MLCSFQLKLMLELLASAARYFPQLLQATFLFLLELLAVLAASVSPIPAFLDVLIFIPTWLPSQPPSLLFF